MSQDAALREHPLLHALWRYGAVLVLGFASGLPLALVGATMQAWLVADKVTLATIGFLGLVGLPYTFKFVWAPLMDRFELPELGRRRGWLVITQLGLAGALCWMASLQPAAGIKGFALVAALVAFLSASQDVVIDAYRTDLLAPQERGFGASMAVLGYRLAMVLSGGLAFIWADVEKGRGWSWPFIYQIMAVLMACAALFTMVLLPRLPAHLKPPQTKASNDIVGFLALVAAVAAGYAVTNWGLQPVTDLLFHTAQAPQYQKWADLMSLLLGLGLTLPLAWWASKLARFDTLNRSLVNYLTQPKAGIFLLLIILYKLGDAFAGALLTPFLLKGVGFTSAEVGVVNKIIGLLCTILGALVGGALMFRIRLYRALLWFGVGQLVSNFGFWLVAVSTKGSWGSFQLPAFNWGFVMLKEATQIDWQLVSVVALENITGGMGTAALVAFLMALCNQRFTATQYALLSALSAVGRVWVGPFAGVLCETMGWPTFYVFSACVAVPGLAMLMWLKRDVMALDASREQEPAV